MRKCDEPRRILLLFAGILLTFALVAVGCAAPAASPTPTASAGKPAPKTEASPAPASPTPAAASQQPAPKPAASEKPYYEGKTVSVIVPFAAGGTYDLLGRLVAKVMPKHIPGNPNMVVLNQPGGGALIGARAAYDAKPDGLTIGHFPSMLPMQQFLGKETHIDFTKYKYLGSVGSSTYVLMLRNDPKLKTVDDLRNTKQTLRMGGLGKGTQQDDAVILLKELFGMNMKLVSGYKATPEIFLAIKQNELDGIATYVGTSTAIPVAQEAVDSGELSTILVVGGPKLSGQWKAKFGDLPYVGDTLGPDDRKVYDAYMNLLTVARPFAIPPGTPANIVQVLSDAMQKTIKDPEFVSEAAKIGIDIDPMSGDTVLQYIKDLLALQEPMRGRLAKLLE
ncbi:MAG: tripartite tricarboxylate transporter substrate-binding protein [Chloroflexi bacterium]|nr:tripartite tricarboxylate transporter substrate-binding protein [Chloroflexota bacterium]